MQHLKVLHDRVAIDRDQAELNMLRCGLFKEYSLFLLATASEVVSMPKDS